MLNTQILNLQKKNQLLSLNYQKNQENLQHLIEKNINFAEQVQLKEDELNSLKQDKKSILKMVTYNQKQIYQKEMKISTLTSTLSSLTNQLQMNINNNKNLLTEITSLEQRLLKQEEMLYTISFDVQQYERKINVIDGKRSMEETVKLKATIKQQKKELKTLESSYKLIKNQYRRLLNDVKQANVYQKMLKKSYQQIDTELNSFILENTSLQHENDQFSLQNDNLLVKQDEYKLIVNKLKDKLIELNENIYNLQQNELDLDIALSSRQKELNAYWKIQQAEIKTNEESRHLLAKDLKERHIYLKKLQAKYYIISNGDDEDDENFKGKKFFWQGKFKKKI